MRGAEKGNPVDVFSKPLDVHRRYRHVRPDEVVLRPFRNMQPASGEGNEEDDAQRPGGGPDGVRVPHRWMSPSTDAMTSARQSAEASASCLVFCSQPISRMTALL